MQQIIVFFVGVFFLYSGIKAIMTKEIIDKNPGINIFTGKVEDDSERGLSAILWGILAVIGSFGFFAMAFGFMPMRDMQ
jgi:hypothetical protein